jgi:integrase
MITRHPGLRPRNVTVTQREIDTVLLAAPDDMRLWLLFCSDLAMRSGTASKIGPRNYDPRRKEVRFVTKCDEALTLPVTEEIAQILATCDHTSPNPYVLQLAFKQQKIVGGQFKTNATRYSLNCRFRRLLKTLEIRQNLRPHDLRRTAAVRMYELTHDARDVQSLLGHRNLGSTIWYLDHDLRPITRGTLELIKRPRKPESEEKSA